MYIPKYFIEKDHTKLIKLMKENSFALLTSHNGKAIQATHLPFHIIEHEGSISLIAHLAIGNPHWKVLENEEVLIVFSGPHTYISSSWYEDENTVPTWNYTAVHVRGVCKIVKEKDELISILQHAVTDYEKHVSQPWKMEEHMDTVHSMLNGIVGIHIEVTSIEGKYKLSQNHSKERREKVIHQLEENYHLYDSKEIAKLMKDYM